MTYVSELGDVEVKFEDLLQPFPQSLAPNQVYNMCLEPTPHEHSPPSLSLCEKVSYKQMFQQLWSNLEASQNAE